MIRILKILLSLAIAASIVAACSTSPTGRSQIIYRSDAELAAESARQFAEMRASIPLETDRAVIDYVHCVTTAIIEVLEPEYQELKWDMAIFDSQAVNAFAMPGGKIGVMVGILEAADNQHRLAAVLGHEVAHVTARHANERASRSPVSNIGVQVAAILLGGGHSGATYTAYEALNAGAELGIMLPFSRGQESEADIIGLEYMARAGFDPRESVALWVNMGGDDEGAKVAEFMSTHPSSERRIEALISEWPTVLPLYNEALAAGRNPNCTM